MASKKFRKSLTIYQGILYGKVLKNSEQGDLIGRIFAYIFENYESSPKVCSTIFNGKSCVLISTKNGFGYILGDFFTK
jgi:hypothetical protein